MDTTPIWLHPPVIRRFPRLQENLRVDVVVVGAGIMGITAAYLLKKRGHTVALLDRQGCAGGDTGHTTAHLTYVTDLRLRDLVKAFGRDDAQAVWDAGNAAIEQIALNVSVEKLDCHFNRVPGFLHAPISHQPTADEIATLREDAQLARELQFDAAFVDSVPIVDRPGVRFANQALFHPVQYLAGLLKTIPGDGSHVFDESEVTEFIPQPRQIIANGHTIDCGYVVVATHVPLMGNTNVASATLFQSKLAPYSSYVVGAKMPHGVVSPVSLWDTSDPYNYLRIDHHETHDYVILGGQDHKTGQVTDTQSCYERLERLLGSILPQAKVDHRWSGQVVETNDGLPYIGETTEGQFVATGFAGNGMTFGTLAAMMALDAFEKRNNPWSELFDVTRNKLRGGTWDYIRENVDYPFYMIKDRLAAAEGRSTQSVKPGEGAILRIDGKRVAAYRNEHGKLTTSSSTCPHMGCIVHWNAAETTWDCPCHGSRFKATGQVIAGPAETPLERIETKDDKQK